MSEDLKYRILKDVKVELHDEFDKNFTRKAFFDEPWPKRMRNYSRGTTMAVTNRLRRSYRGHITRSSIRFTSDAPYAGIHNVGGKIPVTPKMRKFFWAKYYEASGKMKKTAAGKTAATKQNTQLNDQALFWRNMALRKGDHIEIPKRQVIGDHRQVKRIVERVSNAAIKDYVQKNLLPILKK